MPAFYSYAYPAPAGFAAAKVKPAAAFCSKELGEFLLPYDAMRERARSRRDADGILAEHLRSGGGSGEMGPRGAGVRDRRTREVRVVPQPSGSGRRNHLAVALRPRTGGGDNERSGVVEGSQGGERRPATSGAFVFPIRRPTCSPTWAGRCSTRPASWSRSTT